LESDTDKLQAPCRVRDPFDRMLIAQAILDDLVLVSNERAFDAYGVPRLW
jgi:PIN domain nuclease of toxin-antitoxin system